MVKITGLHKHFDQLVLFDRYNAVFDEHRCCIFAPNGTGKSTLLCMIAGIMSANKGVITFQGTPVSEMRGELSIASNSVVYPGFITAKELLELTQSTHGCQWPGELIEQFAFSAHQLTPIESLSTGNYKKLQLINALMRAPKLLLLDEPNLALDDYSTDVFWEVMAAFEHQVIVASNEPHLFEKHGFVTREMFSI